MRSVICHVAEVIFYCSILYMETIKSQEFQNIDEGHWAESLRPVFADKKVILTGEVLAGILPRARTVMSLGAESTFILATEGVGTGETPTEQDGTWMTLDLPVCEDLTQAVQESQRALGDLPENVIHAINEFDPDNEALVLGTFLNEHAHIAGRKALAYRKPEWLALDDKTVIDDVWDRIGIPREPSIVVSANKAEISNSFDAINKGAGVVISGDSRDGIGGGADGVRWIKTKEDLDASMPYFEDRCDQVRVMPFLEGIPCSIHGMVFDDYVASYRPVEMVVLREKETSKFFYAGTATYWDPAPEDREEMRSIAKKVGASLREDVNYRGLFTIDGVMTANGFRPTELNPRAGAGIKSLTSGFADLPLEMIAQAVISGANIDFEPEALEKFVIEKSDEKRGGGTWKALDHKVDIDAGTLFVKLTNGEWQWTDNEEDSDAKVLIGEGVIGSFVRLDPKRESIPVGASFGSLAENFWHLMNSENGNKISNLEPAKDLKS